MAKLGEINYLRNLGDEGRQHAMNKPFSDGDCANYLLELGAIFALLPSPPLRLLDVGCGTGWTSRFFARRGFDVLGVDICGDMIQAAQQINDGEHLPNLQFRECDYENLDIAEAFDAAVFYDALHHAVDEEAALRMVYQALKPGGVCVTSEPGRGHANWAPSQAAMAKFDVTEKDMPPGKIIAVARKVGFRKCEVHPHAFDLNKATYAPDRRIARWLPRWLGPLRRLGLLAALNLIVLTCRYRSGIVVLTK